MTDKIITEAILTSEKLSRLSSAAECCFFRFLVASDWKGRLPLDYDVITQRCYPLHDFKITRQRIPGWLDGMEASGLIARCAHRGKEHYILSAPELYRLTGRLNTGRLSPSIWAAIKARIFGRDNYTCQYCGAKGAQLHCDHVVPLSRGGRNDEDNLLTACQRCNVKKGRRTPAEWRDSSARRGAN